MGILCGGDSVWEGVMTSKRIQQGSGTKTDRPLRANVQRENSVRGKPFEKGNPHAFKPGQSGNPAGRPKSAILSDAYRRKLAEVDESDPDKRTYAEVIADQMILKAKEGDVSAIREIADRVEGKARQTVTLTFDERERLEQAIKGIMEDAKCTRDLAIQTLIKFRPEASALLNTN